ncbi:hypothetical protein J4429_05910 [Candidatus Pacearchaeota archaeon]|nr:hypothetical protein [Candidatus Pacearchaeota archaeon]
MPIKKPRKLRIHNYGNYCTFIAPSESYFTGIKIHGSGHGPFEYEVFEGGSRFLGEGSRNPLKFFYKTNDSREAMQIMRERILERADRASVKDKIKLDDRIVEHD